MNMTARLQLPGRFGKGIQASWTAITMQHAEAETSKLSITFEVLWFHRKLGNRVFNSLYRIQYEREDLASPLGPCEH